MLNLNKTVKILRKYRNTAIERDNKRAQIEVECIMGTLNELYKMAAVNEESDYDIRGDQAKMGLQDKRDREGSS